MLLWSARKIALILSKSTFGRDTYMECGLQIGQEKLSISNRVSKRPIWLDEPAQLWAAPKTRELNFRPPKLVNGQPR